MRKREIGCQRAAVHPTPTGSIEEHDKGVWL